MNTILEDAKKNAEHERTVSLKIKLDIEDEGDPAGTQEILAGDIKVCDLKLFSYGFHGTLLISAQDNATLDEILTEKKKSSAKITFNSIDPNQTDPLLELEAVITNVVSQTAINPIHDQDELIKIYKIHFCDKAKAAWDEHFPMCIYVDKTMTQVITDNKYSGIKLDIEWDNFDEKHPIIAFKLEYKGAHAKHSQCNFYSFLHWYLNKYNGILLYDYSDNSYKITDKKSEEDPFTIFETWVSPPECHHPIHPRYSEKHFKHTADIYEETVKKNEDAFDAIRRDYHKPDDYQIFPEHDFGVVAAKLTPTLKSFKLHATMISTDFSIEKLVPGAFIKFKFRDEAKGTWSQDPIYKDKLFRITHLDFLAINPIKYHENQNRYSTDFSVELFVHFEEPEEEFVSRPSFVPLIEPFQIEGKVFCEDGAEAQTTYNLVDHELTPFKHYLIEVPLAKGEKLMVPYRPTDQHYQPFCKSQKVLLDVYFHTAIIREPTDPQPFVIADDGLQANQFVYGSNGNNIKTVTTHSFKDENKPVLLTAQSTAEGQDQSFKMQNKEIDLAVVEKGKKRVQTIYHSDNGFTLVVHDDDAGTKLESVYDLKGKSITITCTDGSDTSTAVFTPNMIHLDTTTFSIKADDLKADLKNSKCIKAGSSSTDEAPTINQKGKVKQG